MFGFVMLLVNVAVLAGYIVASAISANAAARRLEESNERNGLYR